MNESTFHSNRRKFIKSGVLAAGAAALGPALAPAASPLDKQVGDSGAIPMRRFGKTGRTLPIFGMGGSAMVAIFIRSYGVKLLSMDQRIAMVTRAYDSG